MQSDEAILRMMTLAEKAVALGAEITQDDHHAADLVRQIMISLKLGMSVRGRMVPDYSPPTLDKSV